MKHALVLLSVLLLASDSVWAVDEPSKPTLKAVLKDEQKVAHWEWDKFRWQAVDASLVRPVSTNITIPAGHRFVTVVVDDARGVRVRNLLDAVEVTKLGAKGDPTEALIVAVEWNGLDDYGRSVPDGSYRLRGCSHPGLRCIYEYSFLNPGSPPWEHYKNSGWGGDHGYPHAIACLRGHKNGAWRVAIGGHTAEGGSPAFVIGAEDKKTHAFGRGWSGPKAMAASDGLLWIALGGGKDIQRIKYHSGGNAPFQTSKGAQPVLKFDEDVWAIAVGTDKRAVLVHKEGDSKWKDHVVLFDKNSGENRVVLPLDEAVQRNGLTFDATGRGLLISTVSGLFRVPAHDANPQKERSTPADVEKPGALTKDADGNLFVMDRPRLETARRDRHPLGQRSGSRHRTPNLPLQPQPLRQHRQRHTKRSRTPSRRVEHLAHRVAAAQHSLPLFIRCQNDRQCMNV